MSNERNNLPFENEIRDLNTKKEGKAAKNEKVDIFIPSLSLK
jgi:hypothetical protein